MGSAISALRRGMNELNAQFKTTYTYKGVSFIGVAATATAAESISSGGSRAFSPEHKFRIGVDPTQTAFTAGLPKASELILRGAERLIVIDVETAPNHHVAYISVK